MKLLRKLKKRYKQFNDFLNEDSFLSWLVYIVLAFVLVRFIIYPGLGFIFGTPYPIVAVVSGSMEHDGNFNTWWNSKAIMDKKMVTQEAFYESYGISKQDFQSFRFKNGFNTGDIMILLGTKPENIQVGDIIVFMKNRPEPIIHRVIEKDLNNGTVLFRTKGDHNLESYAGPWLDETNISGDQIIGRAVFRVPFLGYVKIIFFDGLKFITGIFK